MGKAIREILLKYGWGKFPTGNAYSLAKKGLFLSVNVDDIKMAEKKQNLNPVWKIQMKDVDLGEPTSFLDHVYLFGLHSRDSKHAKTLLTITGVRLNPGCQLEV